MVEKVVGFLLWKRHSPGYNPGPPAKTVHCDNQGHDGPFAITQPKCDPQEEHEGSLTDLEDWVFVPITNGSPETDK